MFLISGDGEMMSWRDGMCWSVGASRRSRFDSRIVSPFARTNLLEDTWGTRTVALFRFVQVWFCLRALADSECDAQQRTIFGLAFSSSARWLLPSWLRLSKSPLWQSLGLMPSGRPLERSRTRGARRPVMWSELRQHRKTARNSSRHLLPSRQRNLLGLWLKRS